ncbi:hypothetical protein [Hydrogenophaga sp. BPS33]|uniref:hypothetical protein n=1 Tax=Hydrogenophaga sp. BPS33 TaxID=2651974 RepID=UPI00191787AB|nr:hypothetical protein [Hydrogenophaga sp. BPS33]
MAPHKSETQLAGWVTQEEDQKAEASIFAQDVPDRKAFDTARAEFAILGRALTLSRRAGDGRHIWTVSRWNEAHTFGHWNDVLAHLSQAGGAQ